MLKYVLVVVYLCLSLSGLVFMKLGGNTGSFSMKEGGEILFGINWVSLIGFLCYICSFLLYTRIIIMFDLSYITPICTGIIQVLTLIASYIVFHEDISLKGVIGACIVILGIIVMNLKTK